MTASTLTEVSVDGIDLHILSGHVWHVVRGKNTSYAAARRGRKTIYLHRLIMGEPIGMEVHHKNGNGLDCRRENLEVVTHKKNIVLMRRKRPPRSGYQGVYQKRGSGWFRARCMVDGKWRELGSFATAKEASEVYERFVAERAVSL